MLDKIEQCIHGRYMAVRAIVRGTVAYDFACLEYPGKILVLNANGRICLVILQQDIVPWLIFLDEIILQQQGVFLRVHHNVSDIGYFADEYSCFPRFVFFVEIGGDPSL